MKRFQAQSWARREKAILLFITSGDSLKNSQVALTHFLHSHKRAYKNDFSSSCMSMKAFL